jgi:hypothetical protein
VQRVEQRVEVVLFRSGVADEVTGGSIPHRRAFAEVSLRDIEAARGRLQGELPHRHRRRAQRAVAVLRHKHEHLFTHAIFGAAEDPLGGTA